VPTWLLKGTRGLLKGADWAKDAADRLVSSDCCVLQCVVQFEKADGRGLGLALLLHTAQGC
jgi:hypothetical protein